MEVYHGLNIGMSAMGVKADIGDKACQASRSTIYLMPVRGLMIGPVVGLSADYILCTSVYTP